MAGKSYLKNDSGNWARIKKMYIKTGGTTWTAIRKAYIKNEQGLWKKVFDTASNRPFIRGGDFPKIRLNTYRTNSGSAGTVNPVIEAPPVQYAGPRSNNVQGTTEAQPVEGYPDDNMGTTLFGYDGDWVSGNGTSMTFAYDWFYNNDGDANNIYAFTNTSASYDDRVTNDSTRFSDKINGNMYGCSVYFRVRATNSAGTAPEVSTPVRIIKQPPNNFTLTMAQPGVGIIDVAKTVTISGENLWYNGPNQYASIIEWFSEDSLVSPLLNSSTLVKTQTLSSTTATYEGDGTAINDTSSYTPTQLNPKGYSDSNKYLFARLTLKNSGTEYTGNTITLTANMTTPVGVVNEKTPQWGEDIYVSTNGYIGLAGSTGNSTLNDTGTQGHVVSFLNKDLRQISLKYWADTTKYIVDWSGRLYDVTSTAVTYRYQAHFYPGQNYVDFYVISNAGGTSGNAYLFNGVQQVAWGASKPASTAYRITIKSGVAFQTIAYNPQSTTNFTTITTMDGVDDGVTTLTLAKGTAIPENSASPQYQLISGTANKVGATYRLTSGSWLNVPTEYNYYIYKNDINGTTLMNSGWTTATYFDYTFTATTTQTVGGLVIARNAGGESLNAYATSIGPFETLAATGPTSVSAANNGSSTTVTISWLGAANATRYRIYWTGGSTPPSGGAASNFDEEKTVDGSTITSTSGSWAWGPADTDKNGNTPSGLGAMYYMVSASSDGITWTPYVVTSSPVGVVVPVPTYTALPTLSPTGPYNVGDTLTFGVGTWSNSPTSYSLQLWRGTPGVATSETLVKDAGNVTSSTYVIQASDYSLGRYYFRAFASATNSGGTSNNGVLTPGAESGPLNPPLSSPTPTSVTYSGGVFTINFSGGSGPYYQGWYQGSASLIGTDASSPDAPTTGGSFTSSPLTRSLTASAGSTYYWWVRSAKTATGTGTGNVSAWSGPVSVTIPVIPTVTIAANSGVSTNQGTINWTSTNQASYSVDGTFTASGNPDTTTRSVSKTGLTQSTTYTGTITVTSSTGNTATASYSLRTSDPAANYTLSYNANGGTGTMADTVGNGSVTLRANSFTRTNCTFSGWATSSGGGVVYSNQGAYTLSATATLYAKWAAVANSATAPTVSFTGTSGSGSSTTRSWSWTTGTVTGGTATGYEWQISSTGSTSGYGAWTFTTARTLTVTANTARWLRVRKVYTDGLGVTQVGAFNNTGV
jgi:hypothetical protein